MNDMMLVTILVFLFALSILIMNLLSRPTEKQTRHSAVNLNKRNKIKPDVACSNQHALPRPAINDEFSTPNGEDLNNQSFLRLMDEKNLIVLENQRLANELSLVQSQLTDSHLKLRQFQNVHDQLAIIKSELEEKKSVITDMIEKNLRLANDDSRLKRKVEDKDRMITLIELDKESLANELSLLQSQLADSDSKIRQSHIESAITKSELEEKKSLITDMTERNLHLTNENSRLRLKVEDKDRIIASSSEIEKNLVLDKERLANKLSLLQSQLADSSSIKLQMFQNVHDELATTKSELEENKREMTDIIGENLRLTNENLRLRRKIEDRDKIMASRAIEKNQIVLENQRLANELSLVQSQLTDSHSKLRQFHIELATTKRKLEEKKSFITDITEKNLRLTNENSLLRINIEDRDSIIEDRDITIEDRDRIMASSAIEKNLIVWEKKRLANELSFVQSQLKNSSSMLQIFQKRQKVHDELATTKRELKNNKRVMTDIEKESKNKTISELETENLRLVENDSQLRRQWDRRPATTATTRETENVYQTIYPDMPPEYENPPSYGASVTARY
ncbi:hypothetical protein DAPPUDRAFT_264522 [Daphnia pulex]|uniref:Uncharacterized protein n=1 Tax=Daphnia pulex TaxID=6669 RepID=E9HRS2_DAPPU|nr:hypothetical protein DAPPUDRAFT_264522 [Daphnia pulex]|eukprot:EFX65569.1 hypothetical protein DAPPUDRAFT_264522 [Daphnia pulex]